MNSIMLYVIPISAALLLLVVWLEFKNYGKR